MLARLGRAAALAGLLVLPAPAWGAATSGSEEGQTLDIRRLAPEQRRRLLAADTIAYKVIETSETELGAGVAMYLPVPLARAAEVLTSPDVVLKDPSITAAGLVPVGATVTSLQGFKLAASEAGDAQDALDATAGSRFHLPPPEIDALLAAGDRRVPRGPERGARGRARGRGGVSGRPVASAPAPARARLPGPRPRRHRALRAPRRHERSRHAAPGGRGRRAGRRDAGPASRRGPAALPGRAEPKLGEPGLLGQATGPGPAE